MAVLFRKSSLEKLANPDQIDRMIKISSPYSWLALAAVFIIIAGTVIWAFFGTLPEAHTVNGIIVNSEGSCAIYSENAGVIEKYHYLPGQEINKGDKIADIKLSSNEIKTVTADKDGTISLISHEESALISAGTEIARFSPDEAQGRTVICYVPLVASQKYKENMKVLVYPTAVDSQKYGHMEAEIIYVDKYASNTASVTNILGAGNLVADSFLSNGPVVAVVCKIREAEDTESGFYWSNKNGRMLAVPNGTVVSAEIIVEESAPITKLIGKVREDTEG